MPFQMIYGSSTDPEPTPPPTAQVYWPNLQLRWWQRQVRYMQVVAAMVFVCVWFMVPVTFAQSLTSASSIQAVASYLAPTVRAHHASSQHTTRAAATTATPHVSPEPQTPRATLRMHAALSLP